MGRAAHMLYSLIVRQCWCVMFIASATSPWSWCVLWREKHNFCIKSDLGSKSHFVLNRSFVNPVGPMDNLIFSFNKKLVLLIAPHVWLIAGKWRSYFFQQSLLFLSAFCMGHLLLFISSNIYFHHFVFCLSSQVLKYAHLQWIIGPFHPNAIIANQA